MWMMRLQHEKGQKTWFMITGAKQPYPGNGIVLGTSDALYDTDARSSAEQLQKAVTWLTDDEVQQKWPDIEFMKIYSEKAKEEEIREKYQADAYYEQQEKEHYKFMREREEDAERDYVYRNYFKI
jgi:hypothetical protein